MYRIYINSDYVWDAKDATPKMHEKHTGEFDDLKDAENALKRQKEWLKNQPGWVIESLSNLDISKGDCNVTKI